MAGNGLTRSLILPFTFLLLLTYNLYSAFAASGGRMGGSDFDSHSSSSSSSSFDSYPSHTSYDSYPSHKVYDSYSSRRVYPDDRIRYEEDKIRGMRREYDGREHDHEYRSVAIVVVGFIGVSVGFLYLRLREQRSSVLKIQIGLSGKARAIQRDLNGIARTANTSTRKGFHYLLTETTLALLRNPDYFISGYSSVAKKWSVSEVEKLYNQLSVEEREKFDIESLVNVDNIQAQRPFILKGSKLAKDYIVVTIIVAAKGTLKLPVIKDIEDLKDALQYTSFLNAKDTMAVEVMWTPQDEEDSLSEDELLEKYPLLRPI